MRRVRNSPLIAALTAIALLAPGAAHASRELFDLLDFAAEMAADGNWREAQHRWTRALDLAPDNPRILNNLAVASEILGDYERAEALYRRALSADSRTAGLHDNAARFDRLQRKLAEEEGDAESLDALPFDPVRMGRARSNRATLRVTGRFRLPPKLEVDAYETLLVASFLVEEDTDLDLNREVTRYLRKRLAKSDLDVLDVTPAPAIPEMPPDELVENSEFWKRLGRTHGADLIVSGVVAFDRRDASGFREVDVVSRNTGQKVRESRFVEQEEFRYAMQVFFFEGSTGALVHRDRLERAAVYAGGANDPLTAFFDLVDALARDVAAVVAPRVQEDTRFVFRR